MISRVLAALATFVVLANADSTFDLQWMNDYGYYTYAAATTPLACFANTNKTVLFSYGTATETDSTANTIKGGADSHGCHQNGGANDKDNVEFYGDMIWALPRGGGAGVCFGALPNKVTGSYPTWSTNATSTPDLDHLKPAGNAADTVFNQNFKYIITRKLHVCAYDSEYAPENPSKTDDGTSAGAAATADDRKAGQNTAAKPKVAYRADNWNIYSSNWNGGVTNVAWSSISTVSAGFADWTTNPSSSYVSGTTADGDYLETLAFNDDCQHRSSVTFAQGSSNDAADNLVTIGSLYENPSTTGDALYKEQYQVKAVVSGKANNAAERIGCASSASLIARSSNLTSTERNTFVSGTKFGGSAKPTFANDNYDLTSLVKNSNIGVHNDVVGTAGLWAKLNTYGSTITHFQGAAVSEPNFVTGKTFFLNNGQTVKFKFSGANTDYRQIGNSQGVGKNKVKIATSISGAGDDVSTKLEAVAFNKNTEEITFQAQKDPQFNRNQGSSSLGGGDFGIVGAHFWAIAESDYTVEYKFSCANIGVAPTTTTIDSSFPYQFYCDHTQADWLVANPTYATSKARYPLYDRVFNGGDAGNQVTTTWASSTLTTTADPVYIGQLTSVTNNGFSVADGVPAIDGSAEAATEGVPTLDQAAKQATAAEDQATGVALIGAGVVVLAVFGSLAICIGAAIQGKMGAK
jgi:hypothetical protein